MLFILFIRYSKQVNSVFEIDNSWYNLNFSPNCPIVYSIDIESTCLRNLNPARVECVPEHSLQLRCPPVVFTIADGGVRSHVIVMSRYQMRHETRWSEKKFARENVRSLRGKQTGAVPSLLKNNLTSNCLVLFPVQQSSNRHRDRKH